MTFVVRSSPAPLQPIEANVLRHALIGSPCSRHRSMCVTQRRDAWRGGARSLVRFLPRSRSRSRTGRRVSWTRARDSSAALHCGCLRSRLGIIHESRVTFLFCFYVQRGRVRTTPSRGFFGFARLFASPSWYLGRGGAPVFRLCRFLSGSWPLLMLLVLLLPPCVFVLSFPLLLSGGSKSARKQLLRGGTRVRRDLSRRRVVVNIPHARAFQFQFSSALQNF